jgi:hypothetical protein
MVLEKDSEMFLEGWSLETKCIMHAIAGLCVAKLSNVLPKWSFTLELFGLSNAFITQWPLQLFKNAKTIQNYGTPSQSHSFNTCTLIARDRNKSLDHSVGEIIGWNLNERNIACIMET